MKNESKNIDVYLTREREKKAKKEDTTMAAAEVKREIHCRLLAQSFAQSGRDKRERRKTRKMRKRRVKTEDRFINAFRVFSPSLSAGSCVIRPCRSRLRVVES